MDDIQIDDTFELLFDSGDFSIGESTLQHQQLLLMTEKGDWRESPTVGIGAPGYLKDNDEDSGLLPEIKQQFEKDGMTVVSVKLDGDKITTDAYYK